jgi:hypothetical protein
LLINGNKFCQRKKIFLEKRIEIACSKLAVQNKSMKRNFLINGKENE